MKTNRKTTVLVALILVLVMAVTACSKATPSTSTTASTTTTAVITTSATSTVLTSATSTTKTTASSTSTITSATTSTTKQTTTTTSATPTTSTKVVKPTGTIRVGQNSLGGEVFDPVVATGTTVYQIANMIMDPLIMTDHDNKLTSRGAVAESWEVAPDGLSWTYHIRKGIKFHDGTDLTSADVKFSLDRFASKDAFAVESRDAIDHVDIVDATPSAFSQRGYDRSCRTTRRSIRHNRAS
jgi:hypothetical protein